MLHARAALMIIAPDGAAGPHGVGEAERARDSAIAQRHSTPWAPRLAACMCVGGVEPPTQSRGTVYAHTTQHAAVQCAEHTCRRTL